MKALQTIIDILRAVVYAWVTYEAIFLSLLYKMAWSSMKRSPIIFALHLSFLFLTMFFTVATIAAFVRTIDINVATPVLSFMTLPAIGLALALRLFRKNSLGEGLKEWVKKNGKNKRV